MNAVRSAALALVLGGSLSGCFNLKYYSTSLPGPGAVHKVWVHAFVGGIATVGEINLDELCPTGVYKMKSNLSLIDLVLTVVTGAIYTPMNVTVTCATGST
jgi:hypothetical protein